MNSIEALENLSITFDEGGYSPTTFGGKEGHFIEVFGDEYKIITRELERLEKLEKVISIIKQNLYIEFYHSPFIFNTNNYGVNFKEDKFQNCDYTVMLLDSKEDYDLLKEVFGNANIR